MKLLLLSQVYIELIGGKQHKFSFDKNNINPLEEKNDVSYYTKKTPIIFLTKEEIKNHENIRKQIKNPIWDKIKV